MIVLSATRTVAFTGAAVALILMMLVGCSRGPTESASMSFDREPEQLILPDESTGDSFDGARGPGGDALSQAETDQESVEELAMPDAEIAAVDASDSMESAIESVIGADDSTSVFGEPNHRASQSGASSSIAKGMVVKKMTSPKKPDSIGTKAFQSAKRKPADAGDFESASVPRSSMPTADAPALSTPAFEVPTEPSASKPSHATSASTSVAETGPFSSLPAGASHDAEAGYATIQVFYATDRMHGPLPLSAYEVTGQKQLFIWLLGVTIGLLLLSSLGWLVGKTRAATLSTVVGCATGVLAGACIVAGQTNIEKRGVTYTGDRGTLVRGICEVTVPDTHEKGELERPSLLRFEIREDQRKHVVLTSATELPEVEFGKRLARTVSESPDRDLLVFIHGYNVDFESAVQRTAQIAVDLPFEGVPVCYSWPSQGKLIGYSIDETNAAWTGTHLETFLLELARDSGADSINVIAHSMGNRPLTAAMQQIRWKWSSEMDPPFDRIVLAAPDVDADRFRRDLSPSLLEVSQQVTLYASSDDQALVASKQVHGYPRAGESGEHIVVVPGVETIDVSGIDLSLLGHSYYGENHSMLRDLYEVVRSRLPAPRRAHLIPRGEGPLTFWQLSQVTGDTIKR